MIVDDNPRMSNYMRKMLASYSDFAVTNEAGTLAQAREILSHEKPDLLFLDLQLPDGEGYDLLLFIQQSYPGLYVVILTGYYANKRDEAYTHGEADYLLKPVDSDELDKVLRRFLKAKKEFTSHTNISKGTKVSGMLALVNANNELCLRHCSDIAFFRYNGKRKMWSAVLDNNVDFTLHKGTTAKDILDLSNMYQQSHQAYIVNLSYIDTIGISFVRLRKPFNLYSIPLSRTFQHDFIGKFRLI